MLRGWVYAKLKHAKANICTQNRRYSHPHSKTSRACTQPLMAHRPTAPTALGSLQSATADPPPPTNRPTEGENHDMRAAPGTVLLLKSSAVWQLKHSEQRCCRVVCSPCCGLRPRCRGACSRQLARCLWHRVVSPPGPSRTGSALPDDNGKQSCCSAIVGPAFWLAPEKTPIVLPGALQPGCKRSQQQ